MADLIQTEADQAGWDSSTPKYREEVIDFADWALETYGAKTYAEVACCRSFG